MADGNGPGGITLSGILLAALLLVLIIASLYFFIAQPYWFPTLASEHGARIDSLFNAVLVVTGIAFVLSRERLDSSLPATAAKVPNALPTGTIIRRSKRFFLL